MTTVTHRSQLLTLLTEACEIEHGLACTYLYAAFSLKQELSEGGMTWQQLQRVRLWAGQIYYIAAQEMLHLAQVWNLQTAIGGTPYYLRPNFPQPSKYYPLNLPLRLERFSLATLDRFIQFERPADVIVRSESALSGPGVPSFRTVGELYEIIAQGFQAIPDLFIGRPERQVDQALVDFPDLVPVSSLKTALDAIALITKQGEGLDHDRGDCHFGIFRNIRRQYLLELAQAETTGVAFEPVRMSISNPTPSVAPHLTTHGANLILDQNTAEAADCFDSLYSLMLRMLQYVFDNATGDAQLLKRFAHGSIEAMTAIIKPLGEALTRMPAGEDYEAHTAGPAFTLARHIALPSDPAAALIVTTEKLMELSARLDKIAAGSPRVQQLRSASANLGALARRFQNPAHAPVAATVAKP